MSEGENDSNESSDDDTVQRMEELCRRCQARRNKVYVKDETWKGNLIQISNLILDRCANDIFTRAVMPYLMSFRNEFLVDFINHVTTRLAEDPHATFCVSEEVAHQLTSESEDVAIYIGKQYCSCELCKTKNSQPCNECSDES